LSEALDELERDDLVRDTLGEHLVERFVAAKREEWRAHIMHVSPWEVDRYLGVY
jgi:glutamine synthetase